LFGASQLREAGATAMSKKAEAGGIVSKGIDEAHI